MSLKKPENMSPELASIWESYTNTNKEIDKQHAKQMAKIIGGGLLSIGSAFIPGTAGIKVAGALGKTIAPMVGKKIGTEIASGLVSGGLSGAVEGLGRGLIENKNPLKTMAQDSAVGLATGGLGGLAVGKIGQNIARKSLSNNPTAQKQYFDDYIADLSNKSKAMADYRGLSQGAKGLGKSITKHNFIGENAQNLDKSKLEKAKEMFAQNLSNEDIRQGTGWFKGVDDKWRYEIPEGTFNENIKWEKLDNTQSQAKLKDVYNNEILYNHYPELAEIEITRTNTNPYNFDGSVYQYPNEEKYGVLLNDKLFQNNKYDKWKEQIEEIYNTPEGQRYKKAEDDFWNDKISIEEYSKEDNLFNETEPGKRFDNLRKLIPQKTDIEDSITKKGKKVFLHELQHLIQNLEGFARGGSSADNNYAKLAGEVESRLVESRQGLHPTQRINTPIKYDFDPSEQIVKFSGQEQFAKDLADDTLKYRDEWVKIGNKDYRVLNLPKKDYGKILHILDTNLNKDIPIGEVLEKSDSNYLYKFQKVSPTDYKFIKRTKLK